MVSSLWGIQQGEAPKADTAQAAKRDRRGEAGICDEGVERMALEPGADRGAMEGRTSRQRTELFDALPAHQARVIARDQRQGTPAPPREAKSEAQSELQYDPP